MYIPNKRGVLIFCDMGKSNVHWPYIHLISFIYVGTYLLEEIATLNSQLVLWVSQWIVSKSNELKIDVLNVNKLVKLNYFFSNFHETTIIHSVPYVVLNRYVVVLLFIFWQNTGNIFTVYFNSTSSVSETHILWCTNFISPSLRNFHRLIRTCLLAGLVWFLLPADKKNHCTCYGVQLSEDVRKIMRAVLTTLGGLFFLGLSLHGAGSVFAAEWSSTS